MPASSSLIAYLRVRRMAMSLRMRYALAISIFLLAFVLHLLAFPLDAGLPYLTFYPAVVIALYLCGIGPGAVTTGLSAVAGYYCFSPPYLSFTPTYQSVIGASIFVLSATFIAALVQEKQRFAAQLADSTRRLRQSEQRYRTLLDDQADDICRYQFDGTIIYVNEAFCRLYGKRRDELIGQHWRPMVWHEDVAPITEKLQSLTPACPVATIENRVVTQDGKIVWRQFVNRAFFDDHGALLEIQSVGRDIDARKTEERRIGYQANHDRLTGLPNRGLFFDRLSTAISRARRTAESVVVFLLDLDDFKPINDHLGHDAGDVVLKIVARRLRSCLRDSDTVGRIGGDEFGIVLGEMESPDDASAFAERIIRELSAPIRLHDSCEAEVGVSIGIATYPLCGTEIDRLMSCADRAMYESKERAKNTYTFGRGWTAGACAGQSWVALEGAQVLGVPQLDQQHQALADRLNTLNYAVNCGEPLPVITRLFDELENFAVEHFETEERLMDQSGYPGCRDHRVAHRQLLDEAALLRNKLTEGGEWAVLQELKNWLFLHIASFDKPMADYLSQHDLEAAPLARAG